MSSHDLLDELLNIERGGWEALSNATGDKFYGSVMTDDGLVVLANGSIMDREAVVNALGQAPGALSADGRFVLAGGVG
ncbi:MAG: hypothetical protein QOH60_3056 [Mycobacterium sp.]|jgi:hypothetical protein|nr:hypothetical protein [Mycobacterium sp.]